MSEDTIHHSGGAARKPKEEEVLEPFVLYIYFSTGSNYFRGIFPLFLVQRFWKITNRMRIIFAIFGVFPSMRIFVSQQHRFLGIQTFPTCDKVVRVGKHTGLLSLFQPPIVLHLLTLNMGEKKMIGLLLSHQFRKRQKVLYFQNVRI